MTTLVLHPTAQPQQWLMVVLERDGGIVAVAVCDLDAAEALAESLTVSIPAFRRAA